MLSFPQGRIRCFVRAINLTVLGYLLVSGCYLTACIEQVGNRKAVKVQQVEADLKNAQDQGLKIEEFKFKPVYLVLSLTYLMFALGHISEQLQHRRRELHRLLKQRRTAQRHRNPDDLDR